MDDFGPPFVRSLRISASTASARASGSGGHGARILQAPPNHAHGVGRTDPVRVLPGLSDRPVDQAPHGAVREHQPVDLLKDQVRRLVPQRGSCNSFVTLRRLPPAITFLTARIHGSSG